MHVPTPQAPLATQYDPSTHASNRWVGSHAPPIAMAPTKTVPHELASIGDA
jgi:hypothetical protein